MKNNLFFSFELLRWNLNDNTRDMPWKGERNPYCIWISEIILQQTRVEYGIQYYERFIKKFPDVKSLATGPEDTVFKFWEGLGYYSRCRNLIVSAKIIHENFGGLFPDTYEGILNLKGVGPYTASAVASFAFDLPHAVLDGNVFRVLARFFGIDIPVNSSEGKKIFSEKAKILLANNPPAIYNQAIMDFGAIICKPFLPLCGQCPLQKKCFAFKTNHVDSLPVKEKAPDKKKRFFNYLIVEYKKCFYIRKRTQKDIWQNLHEFVLIETNTLINEQQLIHNKEFENIVVNVPFEIRSMSEVSRQVLSHQVISGRFFHIEIKKPLETELEYRLISARQLQLLAFPKFITAYLKD